MTKITLKSFDQWGDVNGTFVFDEETWEEIGMEGTGREGHYTTQGERWLYASPKVSPKLGRVRFVLSGTGYYGNIGAEGMFWGTKAREVDLEEALQIMNSEHVARFTKLDHEILA